MKSLVERMSMNTVARRTLFVGLGVLSMTCATETAGPGRLIATSDRAIRWADVSADGAWVVYSQRSSGRWQ